MKRIYNQEKEQFRKLFKQECIDNFEDRFKIFEVLLQAEDHVTANELLQLLSKKGYQFELDFVKDTLKLMCNFGFAQGHRFDDGVMHYEQRQLGRHHDHMICTKCRNIIEFHDKRLEDIQLQIAAAHGFHMLQHKMEIYGICSKCLKNRLQPMSLARAKQGEHLIIKDIVGGIGARMRLLTMGLRLGDEIDVITNLNRGQVVVAADCRRYVLGRGLAQKVMVQPKD